MKFAIKFKHTVEQTYTAIIEAENEVDAIAIFDEEPFEYLEDEEPSDEQGLRIDIIDVEEIDL
jgi:hypothetical protein